MRRKVNVFLALAMVFSAQAQADAPSNLQSLTSGLDARGWEAVGRLSIAGKATCTGALIEPDLVLTAAHCLSHPQFGANIQPSEITFLAGFRNGRATATRTGVALATHPEFDFQPNNSLGTIAVDLALVRLSAPVNSSGVSPFPTAKRPRKHAPVSVVSYGKHRLDTPALQETCHVLARRSGMLVMDCNVEPGSSGAPVFTIDSDGRPQIVSVISSASRENGRDIALGTDLTRPLAVLRDVLAQNTIAQPGKPGKPSVQSLTRLPQSSAKFMRP